MLPLEILKKKFGYSSFRLEQEAIIDAVLQKRDTFVLMPTGGGKSLCYQIPALMFEGITVVISPLIALMKDQVDTLRVNGIAAAFLNSTQTPQQQAKVMQLVNSNQLKLLYLAPENHFVKSITSLNVSFIAIDEAHCISHWGHDFRPEYLMLSNLKRKLPHVPIIALTATADDLTRQDIVTKLELKDPLTFVSSFNRSNIRYSVLPKKKNFERLLEFLETRKNMSGIIYCLSRVSTEILAQDLNSAGYSALAYHAGMEKEQRSKHQEMFLRDEVKIIVATVAFGMGIDKSNVRYVVHMDLPKNIESYYQETGRAGRDGLPSEALLFYSYADVAKMKKFTKIDGNEEQTQINETKLDQMSAYGDLSSCRRKFLLNYFSEQAPETCDNCDVCLTQVAEKRDATVESQMVLSAVSRLQNRFGVNYVIAFLRGAKSEKILDDHKNLKTFGIGSKISKDQWSAIIRDLLWQGYLIKSDGKYPVLKLTAKSYPVLKGYESVHLAKSTNPIVQDTKTRYDLELLDRLKRLRRELAASDNIPPYMILSDATLTEMATYLPLTIESLAKISGFGEVKLRKFAAPFLNILTNHCRDTGTTSRISLIPLGEKETETKQISFQLFSTGNSVADIASMRKLQPSTIEAHLAYYIANGKLAVEKLVDDVKISAICDVMEKNPGARLVEIKQILGDHYDFREINLAKAHFTFVSNQGFAEQPTHS